jgi:hypothetical protein
MSIGRDHAMSQFNGSKSLDDLAATNTASKSVEGHYTAQPTLLTNNIAVMKAVVAENCKGFSGTGNGNRLESNFPVKLHYMLSEIEKDGLAHIVSCQPHGRCFVVHKQKAFVEQILHL